MLTLLLLWCFVGSLWSAHGDLDPDAHKTMVEIVEEKGYPIEEHYITTQDGYILGAFRIPYSKDEDSSALRLQKPAVLLQHGLEDSSFTWVSNPINESLAYILADAGYDVWMGNNRGNRYSQQHTVYTKHQDEFWNFSFDGMAQYDLPAQTDYIIDITGNDKIAYVGHSQGTIQMFATSYYNDMSDRIALFGALAPVAYVGHCESPVLNLMADLHVDVLFELLGINQFLPGTFIDLFAPELCNIFDGGCDFFLELLCGPSQDLNDSRIQVYVSNTPADTSVKNMAHWAQEVRDDHFEMFDYGDAKRNEEHYGKGYRNPPQYNLTAFNIPTLLYSGGNDWLADPKDVDRMVSEMNPEYIVEHQIISSYAHLDFVWGMHAATYIYKDLVSQIANYIGEGVLSTKK